MVLKDLSAHLDDDSVRSYATEFMHTTLEKRDLGTPVLALILTNARVLKDGVLYRKAVQKAAEAPYGWSTAGNYTGTVIWPPSMEMIHNNTKPRGTSLGRLKETLPTIAEICNSLSAPQKSDWDDW